MEERREKRNGKLENCQISCSSRMWRHSLIHRYKCFGRTCCLLLHNRKFKLFLLISVGSVEVLVFPFSIYSVYIKSGNTLNYLLHKNYKLYGHHIRVILKRNSESFFYLINFRCGNNEWLGLLVNVSLTRSASSSLTPGCPLFFSGHKQPVATLSEFLFKITRIWCLYNL
jgi:hypothetical protein